MRLSDFYYEYPDALIAQEPVLERDKARLLLVGETFQHNSIYNLPDILNSDDVLVFNNSKVIPARLFLTRKTGGGVEVLLLEEDDAGWQAIFNSSKKLKVGEALIAPGGIEIIVQNPGSPGRISFPSSIDVSAYLYKHGTVPLPPYIKRPARERDKRDYQTIYAEIPGAVAAPTAGLHFTPALLSRLDSAGINMEYITLHVGLGTFQPVRTENIDDHNMHEERYMISPRAWERIKEARRVIAVGTTTVRALESAALNGKLEGKTDLFIRPGFKFSVVDLLLTNFHQPCSTLFMMVAAFGGISHVRDAYEEAISHEYRLFSYGDAMLLERSL